MKKLEDKFNPKDFEEDIRTNWEKQGYFEPSTDRKQKPYTIMMPPPNVTGKLHMGHALDGTLYDILIRYKRMNGFRTLLLPGTDHASIATEAKVVAKLKEEGIDKRALGREKFLERCWEWTNMYGTTIEDQQRKLGISCDWNRKRFTLDEGMSKAVLEEFITLYERGLIYRGKRMINWCPYCRTSISNAEVEFEEEASHLWHIRYPVVKDKSEKDIPDYIEVATTRPETMLGDTGVAVNPKDERYKALMGRKCILPLVNKEIPIVGDEFVEMDFGTGCVKITPAHDVNDYESGKRHNLELIEVFDETNIMLDIVKKYEGMTTLEARDEIVKDLKAGDYLVSIEDYQHSVGKCYRCHTTIEPRVSLQWFISMEKIAKEAIECVKKGDVKFVPKRYEKHYFNWMENIQDWCISRQLWWGHRIPAYYCEDCDNIMVKASSPEKCDKCGSKHIHQDDDTLDTWFSSALWPFSTLGWPNKTEDLEDFFPTDDLVTGYDIITFWVSRMITQSLELMKQPPFKNVIIHGLVRDSQGRKMSKSLGNGIDPLEVIDQYGTDSLRFAIVSGTSMGNDIRFMPEKLTQSGNFANKIWNATKFVTANLVDENKIKEFAEKIEKKDKTAIGELKSYDKWIIGKINELISSVSKSMNKYDLGIALDNTYAFIWNEFCDWYIEFAKTTLKNGTEEEKVVTSYVLDYSLRTLLKLLHPFMPFITAKLYSYLVDYGEKDIMVSEWPKKLNIETKEDVAFIEEFKEITVKVRNVRTQMNVHPSKKVELIIVSPKYEEKIKANEEIVKNMDFGSELSFNGKVPKSAINVNSANINLYMLSEQLVDLQEERDRLNKEKEKLEAEVDRSEKILANKGFLAKAPEAKVNAEREKLEKYKSMLEEVESRLKNL